MVAEPSARDDGPLKVTYRDGTTEEWDRLWHHQSPLLTLFNTEREEYNGGDSARTRKGNEAKLVPIDRIEDIEYLNYNRF